MSGVALFVSELGGGRGHVTRLNAVASVAKDLGFRTVFASPPGSGQLRPVSAWYFDEVVNSPAFPRLRKPPSKLNVGGLASNLAKVGFIDRRVISSMIHAWQARLNTMNPAIVIGDFAPYARLSCLGRFPFLMVGSGYCLPSDAGLLPFAHQKKAQNPSPLLRRIHDQVNIALKATGTVEIKDPCICLRGDANAVACLPFLDPITDRAPTEYIGPLSPLPNRCTRTPTQTSVYAYLHSVSKKDVKVLKNIREMGFEITVFCDGDNSRIRRAAACLDAPLTVSQITQNYGMVYHQAGLGLSTQCLLAGIPQILNPKHLEAHMTALRLSQTGFATLASDSEAFSEQWVDKCKAYLRAAKHNSPKLQPLRVWATNTNWCERVSRLLTNGASF